MLERGSAEDAEAVVGLRDAAAEWLLGRGIEQWRPGEASVARLAARAERGELFVVRDGGAVVGAAVIVLEDPAVWGPDDGEAGYVHTLVIDRTYAGQGLGRVVLRLAEAEIASRGRARVRLDCVAGNLELRRYYRRAGYGEVGEQSFGRHGDVTLFEKPSRSGG